MARRGGSSIPRSVTKAAMDKIDQGVKEVNALTKKEQEEKAATKAETKPDVSPTK